MIDPTPEQIEAAYQAWLNFPHSRGPQNAENAIRAALVAAAGAAPRECQCHGAGGVTDQKCPACVAPVQAHADTASLVAEARALAVRKVEDSADAEALQIMLGLLCDRLEAPAQVGEAFEKWHAGWWQNAPNGVAKANAQAAFHAGWLRGGGQ